MNEGEFFALLGPSGCGKTTLLRVVAGLELPDEGSVRIEGQDTAGLPAHRRPVNTVFQSYALFPHLTVWNNIAFGLRMKKTASAEIKRRVDQAMELVAGREPRRAQALSIVRRAETARGARPGLVNEPKVLLLDEPLGALDLKLRKELQVELRSLQRRLGMTFLYVTHDQEEALLLSDRMAVMRNGRIEQLGDARDSLRTTAHPLCQPVPRLLQPHERDGEIPHPGGRFDPNGLGRVARHSNATGR